MINFATINVKVQIRSEIIKIAAIKARIVTF